jgi:hypothetical protein
MRDSSWRKWTLMLASGSMLLQVPGCTETATILTAVFTGLSAGGLFYLIRKVME